MTSEKIAWNGTEKEIYSLYHTLTYGRHEVDLDSEHNDAYPVAEHDGTIQKRHTVSFECCVPGPRYTHTLPACENHEGFTNLRITPATALESVELEIGGERIDMLRRFSHFGTEPEFYIMSGERCIPRLHYHLIRINIRLKGNALEARGHKSFTLSYDTVNLKQPQPAWYRQKILIEQSIEEELNHDLIQRIPLKFNNPVIRIDAFLPDNIEYAKLQLTRHHDLYLKKEGWGKKGAEGGHLYFIDFGEKDSVNFSRLDHPVLEIKLKAANPGFNLHIFSVAKNIIAFMAGMAGFIHPN